MATDSRKTPPGRLHRVSTKAAYTRAARDKLVASRSRLDGVNAALRQAVATGRLSDGGQLEQARAAMETRFAEAQARLARLQKSGDDNWEALRDEVDNAWEDLAGAIRILVARFDDETRRADDTNDE